VLAAALQQLWLLQLQLARLASTALALGTQIITAHMGCSTWCYHAHSVPATGLTADDGL